MIFEFTLRHETLGSLEISAPDGWKEAILKLERDKNFHSLIEYFNGSFIFYGTDNGALNGGVDFIRQVEREFGPDAELEILIRVSQDGFSFEEVFSGLLKLEGVNEDQNNQIQVPIIRNDFWASFINRQETPVDIQSHLSLDNESVNLFDQINVLLISQIINKITSYEDDFSADETEYFWDLPDGGAIDEDGASQDFELYTQVAANPVQQEIEDSFTYPLAFTDQITSIFNLIEPKTEGGELTINVNFHQVLGLFGTLNLDSVESDPSEIDDITVLLQIFVRKNEEADILIASAGDSNPGPPNPTIIGVPVNFIQFFNLQTSGSAVMNLVPGDLVYVYAKYTILFNIDVGTDTGNILWGGRTVYISDLDSDVTLNFKSEYQQTNAFGFLLHDAAGQITDRIINRDGTFYSEFLGSTTTIYRQYLADGCGWPYSLHRGLQLRRYSLIEKPFFQSFKAWWDGANPILNLGLGYEEIDDVEVIRVEEKEHFYNPEISLNISNVRQIRRVYDTDLNFKTVKIGYKKWQSEDISGIDDPQTKHTYASRFKKMGIETSIESEFIAASLAIETTRRTTKEKSADYKFDNDTFIIALDPNLIVVSPETSPNVNDYQPELDENFTSITNLLNPDKRYNLRLTPARNLIRWLNLLSGGLQKYPDSVFKFTAGEGNFDMVSDFTNVSDGCEEHIQPLAENGDIGVSTRYLHLSQAYEISIPLEWEEYLIIRNNRKKAIGISQTDSGHKAFFIKELDYEIVKSRAVITAWPIEEFEIQVIPSEVSNVACVPVVECEDAYLTELLEELITESGDCLILN